MANKKLRSALTVDEAVASMVNLDHVPDGIDVVSMLSTFREEASVNHHNAGSDLSDEKKKRLKNRLDICRHRLALAKALLEELSFEASPEGSDDFVRSREKSVKHKYTVVSLNEWMEENLRITIPVYAEYQPVPHNAQLKHKSELLTILDEAIEEHWENKGPDERPKSAYVQAWIKEKHPKVSVKVCESMARIMRPDRSNGK